MRTPTGAGRSGGLLFLAVVLFSAYLALRAVAGVLQLALLVGIGIVLAYLAVDVSRRR